MNLFNWKNELNRDEDKVVLAGQPIAMHCHHYNINLQKTLEDTLGQEGGRLVYHSAEKAIYAGFVPLMKQYRELKTTKGKLEMAAMLYQNCGMGIMHLLEVEANGGRITSPSSHHVTGWLAKHGRRETPGCHFARGWIAGVLAAVFEKSPGHYAVEEEQCKMMRDEVCVFIVRER